MRTWRPTRTVASQTRLIPPSPLHGGGCGGGPPHCRPSVWGNRRTRRRPHPLCVSVCVCVCVCVWPTLTGTCRRRRGAGTRTRRKKSEEEGSKEPPGSPLTRSTKLRLPTMRLPFFAHWNWHALYSEGRWFTRFCREVRVHSFTRYCREARVHSFKRYRRALFTFCLCPSVCVNYPEFLQRSLVLSPPQSAVLWRILPTASNTVSPPNRWAGTGPCLLAPASTQRAAG